MQNKYKLELTSDTQTTLFWLISDAISFDWMIAYIIQLIHSYSSTVLLYFYDTAKLGFIEPDHH